MRPATRMRSIARTSTFGLALALIALTGCYGAANAPPERPTLPTLRDDARAEIQLVTTEAYIDSTGDVHDDRTSIHFVYGGEPVTYTQYRAIVDPQWNATLDRYESLYKKCRRANIPKYAAIGMIVGGLAFGLYGHAIVGEDNEGLSRGIMYGAMGAGALTYFSGWAFFGGRACNEAGRMWDGANPWLEYHDEMDIPDFDETRIELRQLTQQFNEKFGGTAPAEETPGETEE